MESVLHTWEIELLGGLVAVCGERRLTRFRTKRSGHLLALLAARPERIYTREELGELLWPDEDQELQLRRLRDELSKLSTYLGETIFEKQGNVGVRLRPGITSDVARFDALFLRVVRTRAPEQRLTTLLQATALYKGDLLPGYLDDWSLRERERLRAVYGDVLSLLIAEQEALGQLDEARHHRHELATHFPELVISPLPSFSNGTGSHNVDGYFGREADLATIQQWSGRLLTLTGPGGMGKTRLSRQALPDALFVSLAEVQDAQVGLFEALHTTLALPKGDASPRSQVVYALNQHVAPLLILDNFEQLVTHGARLVAGLLEDVPKLRCVVTSRHRLGIAGEVEHVLERLAHAPSVELFLNRARRARPDFAQSPTVLPIVEKIVELLEGLPLAIELAAARSVVLGPVQMRDQLADRLRFLVNRRHAPVERQRSLRATLDWSVYLLSPELKRIFARLSVFRGGWSLEAAETVCRGCALNILDALEELYSHSLITVTFDSETETSRYDMLVVIREYASELLGDAPEELHVTRSHHRDAIEEQGAVLGTKTLGIPLSQKLVSRNLDNLRHAIQWGIETDNRAGLYGLLKRYGGWLFEQGCWDEFQQLMDEVEGHVLDKNDLAYFCSLRGSLARRRGHEIAASLYWNRWLEIAIELNRRDLEFNALFNLTNQAIDRNLLQDANFYINRVRHEHHSDILYQLLILRYSHKTNQSNEFQSNIIEFEKKIETITPHIAIILYLLDIYNDTKNYEKCLHWSKQILPKSIDQKNLFHSARVLSIMAKGLEVKGSLEAAYYAYRLAEQYHCLLASRYAKASQDARSTFEQRADFSPKWVLACEDDMWHTLTVKN